MNALLLQLVLLVSFSSCLPQSDNSSGKERYFPDEFSRAELSKPQICVAGCQEAVSKVRFLSAPSAQKYDPQYCNDGLRMKSICLCSKRYCHDEQTVLGMSFVQERCLKESGVHVSSCDTWLDGIDGNTINDALVIGLQDFEPAEVITRLVLPDEELLRLSVKTWAQFVHAIHIRTHFAWAMWGFWGGIIAIGVGFQLLSTIVSRLSTRKTLDRSALDRSSTDLGISQKLSNTTRAYIILPASFGHRHQQVWGWCTLPTRIQLLVICLYMILNVILASVRYESFEGNIFWKTKRQQDLHMVAARLACLSYGNLLFIWLFSSRNNLFIWLTGWNYTTFSRFHRWIARIVVLQSIGHAVCHTVAELESGGHATFKTFCNDFYFKSGVVPVVLMGLMIPLSIYPIRKRCYEVFHAFHATFALVILICLFLHTKAFSRSWLNDPFLWPCAAVWIFEYIIRAVRLLVLNYKSFLYKDFTATAAYDEAQDVIRVTAHPSVTVTPEPGSYFFLYIPTLSKTSGSHPFTLAACTNIIDSACTSPVSPSSSVSSLEKSPVAISPSSSIWSSEKFPAVTSPPQAPKQSLSFIIRPQTGLTRHLQSYLIAQDTLSARMPIFLEGPYPPPPIASRPLFASQTVLLIAGGTGITPVLAHIQSHLDSVKSSRNIAKHVHLLWVTRSHGTVSTVLGNKLLAAARERPDLKITVHLVGQVGYKACEPFNDSDTPLPSPTTAECDVERIAAFSERMPSVVLSTSGLDRKNPWTRSRSVAEIGLNIRSGRPNIPEVIDQHVQGMVGTLSVFVCGPPRLADDARAAVVKAVKAGHGGVEYFEEQFGW